MQAMDFAGNEASCNFLVTVTSPPVSPKTTAVLTKVYIKKDTSFASGDHYTAALTVQTVTTNPSHVTLNNNGNVTGTEETTSSGCSMTSKTGLCVQNFDVKVNITGCQLPTTVYLLGTTVANQFSCSDVSAAGGDCLFDLDSTTHDYSTNNNPLYLTLDANNFCAKELSKVKLVAYLRTVADDTTNIFNGVNGAATQTYADFAANTVVPGANVVYPPTLSVTLANSNLASMVIVNQTAVGALVKTVSLITFSKKYFNDSARQILFKTVSLVSGGSAQDVTNAQTQSSSTPAIDNHVQFAAVRYAETPITHFPQPTFYVTLTGAVTVTYQLGPSGQQRRRLFTLAQDVNPMESSRRQVNRLEASTTSAQALVTSMSLDSVPSNVFANGGTGLALVVVQVSTSVTDTALTATVSSAVQSALSMPSGSVAAYVVPNSRTGSTVLVQLVYTQTLSTITFSGSQFASAVQQQIVTSTSPIAAALSAASITPDVNFFYVGIVRAASTSATTTSTTPTTTVITSGSDSGYNSLSIAALAVLIVASFAGVFACVVVYRYSQRSKSEIVAVMPPAPFQPTFEGEFRTDYKESWGTTGGEGEHFSFAADSY